MSTEACNRLRVERHFLGEIQGEEKLTLRLHLEDCAKCRNQMTELENERRNYLLAHPFREFAAKKLPVQAAEPKRRALGWLPTGVGVLACLMILPILEKHLEQSREILSSHSDSQPAPDGVRSKGEPILEFYCKRNGVVHQGLVSEEYRAGDELQFVYGADNAAYVTLASVDAGGVVSLYRVPGEKFKVSQPAKPGNRQALPFAVTLDASPGLELFVMVYSLKPMVGDSLESWLKLGYARASGNLNTLANSLPAPPLDHSKVKGLLLKKIKS